MSRLHPYKKESLWQIALSGWRFYFLENNFRTYPGYSLESKIFKFGFAHFTLFEDSKDIQQITYNISYVKDVDPEDFVEDEVLRNYPADKLCFCRPQDNLIFAECCQQFFA